MLFFGPAGIPLSCKASSTLAGLEAVASLGLGCMEIQFGRGVRMSDIMAESVRQTASRTGIKLSVHAPYFINLNAIEYEKIVASQKRLLHSSRIAAICGAESVVFHAGSYMGNHPDKAYNKIRDGLSIIRGQLCDEAETISLRPEVTGKSSLFGTLDEILQLSIELDGIAPCIDFAHLHARTGKHNSFEEFVAIIDKMESKLGRQSLENIHIHVAGICYGKRGEIKHVTLDESDFQYRELLQALKSRQVSGRVICESPNLENDALLLQRTYNSC
ncbi:MAG: TIM barrel protein [Chloroflexota bacterium]|nr:TIM barrel protein [Chloroflexota bacterium]